MATQTSLHMVNASPVQKLRWTYC